eukprot:GILJ01003627.1.p1 GENE.GILJ01003627.1~~GILJ01003627.1.p1  ORF type:complete len:790 (+),score=95.75 GILJ01003627.1:266-2371(+)
MAERGGWITSSPRTPDFSPLTTRPLSVLASPPSVLSGVSRSVRTASLTYRESARSTEPKNPRPHSSKPSRSQVSKSKEPSTIHKSSRPKQAIIAYNRASSRVQRLSFEERKDSEDADDVELDLGSTSIDPSDDEEPFDPSDCPSDEELDATSMAAATGTERRTDIFERAMAGETGYQGVHPTQVDSLLVEGQREAEATDTEKRKGHKQVKILQSVFIGRPGTIFFDYHPSLGLQRDQSRVQLVSAEDAKQFALRFKINDSAFTYNCVVNGLKSAGFRLTTGEQWNAMWTGVLKPEDLKDFTEYQKCNHFPGTWALGRKDNLWRNVSRMKRMYNKHFDFVPATYLLPTDYDRFQADREEDPKAFWILKPCASSCGRGIRVLTNKSKVKKKNSLIQRYLANPMTINGYKFDLRIYVLVSSFDPLRIYLYEDGLTRFATEKYSTSAKTVKTRYMHLTNYSVNKKAEKFVKNSNPNEDMTGSKWSLKAFKKYLTEQNLDVEEIFERIKDVIIKTIISVEAQVVNNLNRATRHRGVCFELYGFDILIDKHLKPWLLEVNVSPSLSSSSPLDRKIKHTLLSDVFNLVGFVAFDRKKHERQMELKKQQRLLGLDKGTTNVRHRNVTAIHNMHFDEMTDEDWDILLEMEEESYRRGNFQRIFPLAHNVDYYAQFFETPRYCNTLAAKWLKQGATALPATVQRRRGVINC